MSHHGFPAEGQAVDRFSLVLRQGLRVVAFVLENDTVRRRERVAKSPFAGDDLTQEETRYHSLREHSISVGMVRGQLQHR